MISETKATHSSLVTVRVIRKNKIVSEWEGENAVTAAFQNGCASAFAGAPVFNPDNVGIQPYGQGTYQVPMTATASYANLIFTGSTTAITTSGSNTNFTATLANGQTDSSHTAWATTSGTITDMLYSGDTLQLTWTFTFSSLTTIGNQMLASRLSDATNQAVAPTKVGVSTAVNSTGVITSPRYDAGNNSISASGNLVTATGSFPVSANGAGYPGSTYNVGYVLIETIGSAATVAITNAAAATGKRADLTYQVAFT